MTKKPNAIIYCRVSSVWQEKGWWLPSQELACRNYCDRKEYNIVWVFHDSFTWWDLDRPWINRLFEFIDKNRNKDKVDIFVAEDISRIARSYLVHIELTTWLLSRWVKYELVNMKFEETSTWKLMEWMMALNAEYFRMNNKEQVFSRTDSRLLDWYWTRPAPLWYKYIKAPIWGKMLAKDEPNASIIQEALNLYANWVLNSVSETAHFLENKWLDMGQYEWKRKNKNSLTHIHTSVAHSMLKQLLYTWYIEYIKTKRDKNWIIVKERNIPLRKGKHEGLIDLDTYERIQERLSNKRPYTHEIKTINPEYPLRWFIVCKCCNLPFTSGKSKSKNQKRTAYYQFNKKCIHHWKSIPANKLHQEVSADIKWSESDVRFLEYMKKLLLKENDKRNDKRKLTLIDIGKKMDSVDVEIDNLLNSLASSKSSIVKAKIEHKIEELSNTRSELLKEAKKGETPVTLDRVIEIAFEILSNTLHVWENGTIEQKQVLLRLILNDKIIIDFWTKTYWTLPYSSFYQQKNALSEDKTLLVDPRGVEPLTSSVQTRRSSQMS